MRNDKPRSADDVDASCWQQMMADRVAAHAARVEREQAELGIRHIPRGRPCPVIRSDGTPFASVSDAARASGVTKVDNICQAIRRGGMCAGWRWAYADKQPADFLTPAALFPPFSSAAVRHPILHITSTADALSALQKLLKNHRIPRVGNVAA
jgi:hypothetical protein